MKAIYFVLAILPVYLVLVVGDFYYNPSNLLIPLAFVVVLIIQALGPLLLKRMLPVKMLNLLGGVGLALVGIHVWMIISGAELASTTAILLKAVVILGALAGLGHLLLKSTPGLVHPVAAGGLGLGLADLLILVLLGFLYQELSVFFYISMVPLVLVLFFNSFVTFMKRPQPA